MSQCCDATSILNGIIYNRITLIVIAMFSQLKNMFFTNMEKCPCLTFSNSLDECNKAATMKINAPQQNYAYTHR